MPTYIVAQLRERDAVNYIGVAIAAAVSIGCINLFVFILLKSCCDSAQVFKALALHWLKLQCILYGLLIVGWIVWHALTWALGDVGQNEFVRIALAFVVSIPAIVMLLYVRRWVRAVGQMASERHAINSNERGDGQ